MTKPTLSDLDDPEVCDRLILFEANVIALWARTGRGAFDFVGELLDWAEAESEGE